MPQHCRYRRKSSVIVWGARHVYGFFVFPWFSWLPRLRFQGYPTSIPGPFASKLRMVPFWHLPETRFSAPWNKYQQLEIHHPSTICSVDVSGVSFPTFWQRQNWQALGRKNICMYSIFVKIAAYAHHPLLFYTSCCSGRTFEALVTEKKSSLWRMSCMKWRKHGSCVLISSVGRQFCRQSVDCQSTQSVDSWLTVGRWVDRPSVNCQATVGFRGLKCTGVSKVPRLKCKDLLKKMSMWYYTLLCQELEDAHDLWPKDWKHITLIVQTEDQSTPLYLPTIASLYLISIRKQVYSWNGYQIKNFYCQRNYPAHMENGWFATPWTMMALLHIHNLTSQ